MFNPIRLSRATTLRPQNGVKQINSRLDAKSQECLDDLIDYYTALTGLRANSGTVVRRAIRLLRDQLNSLNPAQEDKIIRQCSEGNEPVFGRARR